MSYTIDRKDAKWLVRALSKNEALPQCQVAQVLMLRGVRMIGATDCYRLHAMEAEAIPLGLYSVDPKTGTLTPATLDGWKAIDWSIIVPRKTGITAQIGYTKGGYCYLDTGDRLNEKHIIAITKDWDEYRIEMVGAVAILTAKDGKKFGVTLAVSPKVGA